MIHVGILLCGEHYPEAIEQYGTYDDDFKNMLGGVIGVDWQYSVWRCYEGAFPNSPNDCDAWIISGSKWGVYDQEPWISDVKLFVRELDQNESKVLGICFGHQVIHSALGGHVEKSDRGWGVGAYSVELYRTLGSIPSGAKLSILAMHQDQVIQVADGFTLVGGTGFCPNAITQKGRNIVTFQAHPEFEDGFYQGLCEHVREKVGGSLIEKTISELGRPDDRERVRHYIQTFMRSESSH